MSDSLEHTGAIPNNAPAQDMEQQSASTFALQIISPSIGVSAPLSFSHLPTATTVNELKAKIRDALPTKPVDEYQRLIHRGRMLGNGSETMASVFGESAVSAILISRPTPINACQLESSETQTLHLVLHPTAVDPPPAQTAAPNPIQASVGLPNLPQPRPQSTSAHTPQASAAHLQARFQEIQRQNAALHHSMRDAQAVHQRLQEQVLDMEQRYRDTLAAAAQPHSQGAVPLRFGQPGATPPAVQALLNQQQRERAARGRQGIQDTGSSRMPLGSSSPSGRLTPGQGQTSTIVQQGTGPNGESWRTTTTTTINEMRAIITTPVNTHQNGHPAAAPPTDAPYDPVPEMIAHMQANARGSSRPPSATPSLGGAQRSASVPRLPNYVSATANGAPNTETAVPLHQHQHGFLHGVPPLNARAFMNQTPFIHNLAAPPATPTVYILSSPSGPRALLVTSQNTHLSRPPAPAQIPVQGQQGQPQQVALPEFRNRHANRGRRRRAEQDGDDIPAVLGAHVNAGAPAGALAARLPNIIWLVVRLIGFVYFFTNGNASWGRWLLMTALSFIVLMANLGLFNGLVNGVWAPIRAHVENIIPLAGPDAALIPAANAAPIPNPQPGVPAVGQNEPLRTGPHGELDPQQVADRLLAQQRQQQQHGQSWLRARMRRIEHSMLLFMASLVPGVGERHIAAREAAANERQRQIDAAAAAAVAAANEAGGVEASSGTERTGEVDSAPREAQADEHAPLLEGQAA